MFKFADDAKSVGRVGSKEGIDRLKEDLVTLFKWSEYWKMKFNVGKCSMVGIGFNNNRDIYDLGGNVLERVEAIKHLGIIASSDMKASRQCCMVAVKGNQILGMIRRTLSSRSKAVMLQLCKAVVRSHFEYCIQASHPHFVEDMKRP